MGGGQSKEEELYDAVQKSNHQAVKTLRRDGASLEWVDKEGRTPLILACTRGDLYDMVITLLDEGAKLDAYRAGAHGGYPLHHAAKRGLDKTVILLLSRGANPLAINDDGLTPLDMARNRSHVSIVRTIEERICLFSGTLRELTGPGFLEIILPQFVTKKIWVVVLPTDSDPRKPQKNELVIYQTAKVAIPRTVISLAKAEVEEPKFNHHDPVLIITATDKTTSKFFDADTALHVTKEMKVVIEQGENPYIEVKFRFQAEMEGDKAQLERFYSACARGIHQRSANFVSQVPSPTQTTLSVLQGLQAMIRPPAPQLAGNTTPPNPPSQSSPSNVATSPVPGTSTGKAKPSQLAPPSEPIPDEVALAIAINASIISASAEGIPVSPSAHNSSSWDGGRNNWGPSDEGEKADYGDWGEGNQSTYGGWGSGSSRGAGPSRLGPSREDSPSTSESKPVASKQPLSGHSPSSGLTPTSSQSLSVTVAPASPATPSAPPLPIDGPIHYPSVDTSPVQLNYTPVTGLLEGPPVEPKAEEKSGQCVVCWDAPAEAVCIPCGHLSGCMDCLMEIKSKNWGCPVCRAPIQQVVKVYAV